MIFYNVISIFLIIYVTMSYLDTLPFFFKKTITVDSNLAYGSRYKSIGNIISDKEGNIYKLCNVPLLLHFKAAEHQAMLKPGETFHVKGFGVRIPFLDLYPIIYDVEK